MLLFEPDNTDEYKLCKDVYRKMGLRALSMGGTCTGEHGIGLHKIGYLVEEAGDDAVDLMRRIKRALDPDGIMNPGKIFRA